MVPESENDSAAISDSQETLQLGQSEQPPTVSKPEHIAVGDADVEESPDTPAVRLQQEFPLLLIPSIISDSFANVSDDALKNLSAYASSRPFLSPLIYHLHVLRVAGSL